jgi:hypothetical protein
MKYVKVGDPVPAPETLAKIKADAIAQLDQYSSDPALAEAWRLRGTGNGERGTVELHRLVLVFHGGDCVLADEV